MNSENIITIRGQEGTEVASLTHLQSAIQPHVPAIIIFWWCLWVIMFVYVLVKHLIIPLIKR